MSSLYAFISDGERRGLPLYVCFQGNNKPASDVYVTKDNLSYLLG